METKSPVILICVQNPDFFNLTVTHLHNHFFQYGAIEKILIFERNKPIWKALIQFEHLEHAQRAAKVSKGSMQGLSILVFPSNRTSLDFQARNQYARYFKDQPIKSCQSLVLQAKSPVQQVKEVQSQVLPGGKGYGRQDSSSLSTQLPPGMNFSDPGCNSDYEEDEIDEKEEFLQQFERVVNSNIDALKSFSEFKGTFASQQLPVIPLQVEKIAQSEILSAPMKMEKLITKVVYANWFDPKQSTMLMIYNIFSTFGNIVRMIYFKTKCNVLIEYTTEVSVKFLLTHFNEAAATLFGQKLKVYPSNYDQIFFRNCEVGQLPKDTEEEEYYMGSEQTFRYQNNNFKYLVPPTQQIILTNLKKEFCDEGLILEMFGAYGAVERIKIFCEEQNKNKCLIKFKTVDSAIQAMAHMHNHNYNKRRIQIFFSKTRW